MIFLRVDNFTTHKAICLVAPGDRWTQAALQEGFEIRVAGFSLIFPMEELYGHFKRLERKGDVVLQNVTIRHNLGKACALGKAAIKTVKRHSKKKFTVGFTIETGCSLKGMPDKTVEVMSPEE